GKCVEYGCGAGLWNAGAATACSAKCCNSCNRGRTSQGAGAGGPVHSESPELDTRSCNTHQQVRRVSRWQCCAFEVCGFHAVSRGCIDTCLACRQAGQHAGAFQGAYRVARERTAVSKHVVADVIRVRPNAHLRIVVEAPVIRKCVTE